MIPRLPRFAHALPRILALAAGLAAAVGAQATVSGKVFAPDGAPKAGVKVLLVRTADSTTTDEQGAWSLAGPTAGVRERSGSSSPAKAGRLRREGTRLRVGYEGRDAAGRLFPLRALPAGALRRAADEPSGPDTLVYSFEGRVFLRDTISVPRADLVRTWDTTWNPDVVYGWIEDERDGKVYRSVRMGIFTWMAQNLDHAVRPDDSTWCYGDVPDSCRVHGRLYSWAAAMGLTRDEAFVWTGSDENRRGACPVGWHVPSKLEWQFLSNAALGPDNAGRVLCAAPAGKDSLGFRGLFSGLKDYDRDYLDAGKWSYFWTATAVQNHMAWYGVLQINHLDWLTYSQGMGASLRCVQDR